MTGAARVAAKLTAGTLALGLAGCGTVAAPRHERGTGVAPSAAPASGEPQMVMVTLSDRGYRTFTVTVSAAQPAMLMVVNRGATEHRLAMTAPLSAVQIVDTAVLTAAPPAADAATGFAMPVAAGDEVDISFLARATGRYPLTADGIQVGTLAVT